MCFLLHPSSLGLIYTLLANLMALNQEMACLERFLHMTDKDNAEREPEEGHVTTTWFRIPGAQPETCLNRTFSDGRRVAGGDSAGPDVIFIQ